LRVTAVILILGAPTLVLADTFSYTTIDFTGATQTLAAGINSSGQIVGGYILPDQSRHGFLDVSGTFTTIDDPSATTGSENVGINDSGQIVGAYNLNPPEAGHVFEGAHAFVDNAGTFTTIDDSTAGVTSTTAEKINNSGNIVGVYRTGGPGIGFLDVGGVFTDVNFPGGTGTHANGINNAGNIVGQYKDITNGPHHGFLDNGGTFSTIDFPGSTNTVASAINGFGNIVGIYDLNGRFGFLDKGGVFSTIAFPGATGTEVYGINDQGDIVGAYQDAGGVIHGFEAAPVPEPGTFALLGVGLMATIVTLLWRRFSGARPIVAAKFARSSTN
jgi:uncharacterized membrane protein